MAVIKMSAAAKEPIWTIPNILSLGRLASTGFIMWAIDTARWETAIVIFLLAAISDWVDGYIARRFHQSTVLGRQLDPLVDKITVIAVLIHLAAINTSGVRPWMVSLILARELIIQALRSHLEAASVGFGAKMAGKLKMAAQCFAIIAVLWVLRSGGPTIQPEMAMVRDALIWASLALTIYSGGAYLVSARTILETTGEGNSA
ncbi:MAG: CDP-diacylglycerol--glycerol-3-phosphate 3-phosphatidyltransferase [Planctomycetota bacterium]|nr:MAG: CDP-diacylglycerol--glycerol-3-phosphate 3-phosphatidyltransferase [Planctomycetota bacterium]